MPDLSADPRGSSNRGRHRSEKSGPGRPAKDAVGERVRIYRAAGPLVLAHGVRGTTMRDIARVSFLSPGGIYHYFRTKAELMLYGLEPEGLSRACSDAAEELASARESGVPMDVSTAVGLYVERNLRMLEFVRPALHAAIELGRPELRQQLSAGLRDDADGLVSSLRSIDPDLDVAPEAGEILRRTILGLALDETTAEANARSQLEWLFTRLLPVGSAATGA